MRKKRIYMDFDGVLNTYTGWQGENELFEPKNGVEIFLKELSEKFEIYIFTTRNLLLLTEWLIKYDLRQYISNITNIKNPAFAYIDDRAVNFDGNYSKLISKLETFSPYWDEI